jgi:predicted RNA binding protein YcfA (HicA-like mRNA interferase family)
MTPRVPSLTPRSILRVLKAHGFIEDHVTGSHYVLYHQETKRRVTVAYHSKELPRGTLMAIIKASGIDQDAFYG